MEEVEDPMSRVLPILFNADMVRTMRGGRKTVTRRVVKGFIPRDSEFGYTAFTPKDHISCRGTFINGYGEKFFKLPCQRGDILYVRETWAFIPCIGCDGKYNRGQAMNCYDLQAVEYDDGRSISDGCFVYRADCRYPEKVSWSPSIHMPKQAARIWLEVTDVRVERLQDMNTGDFLAEGVTIRPEAFNDPENAYQQARGAFIDIWDSTIKQADRGKYGWAGNPWVWVIEFERCEKPE